MIAGRMKRGRFLLWNIAVFGLSCIVSGLTSSGGYTLETMPTPLLFFSVASTVLMTVLSLWLQVQRAHDANRSGLWALLMFIPIVNFFWFVYLLFTRSWPLDNQWGRV